MAPSRHTKTQPAASYESDQEAEVAELLSLAMDEIEQIGITYQYPASKDQAARTYKGVINEVSALAPVMQSIQQSFEALFQHDRIRLFSPLIKQMIAADFIDVIEQELGAAPITPNEIDRLTRAYSPERLLQHSELVEHLREKAIYSSLQYDPLILHDRTVVWKVPPLEDDPMGGKLTGKPYQLDAAVEISKRVENMLSYNANQTAETAKYPAIKDQNLLAAIHEFTTHVIDHHQQKPFKSLSRCELVELIWDSIEMAICNPDAHDAELTSNDRAPMMRADEYRDMVKDDSAWLKDTIKDLKAPPRHKVQANTLSMVPDGLRANPPTGHPINQAVRH